VTAFCESGDVREALQETSLDGPVNPTIVTARLQAVSDWFARQTNGHWYDSGGAAADEVDTSAASASTVRLDVPSSPHRQRGQPLAGQDRAADNRYPVTSNGPYAEVQLPHRYVTSLTTLDVRDPGGGTTDWVADSDFTEGVGEDYYVQQPGQESYGRTYLYLYAGAIGGRRDYTNLLTLDYDYGLDAQTDSWTDVRNGIALLTAAELSADDDLRTSIPDNGQLLGVDTKRQAHLADALSGAQAKLAPYLSSA